MATGLKTRIIYKEHTTDGSGSWLGNYKLLMRAKSIPSPIGEKSMVDVSTLEDLQEVQEPGRRASTTVSVQGAMEKKYLDALYSLEDKKLDFMILYGTDGIGGIAKYVFTGTVSITPDEATEEHLTFTANISVASSPEYSTDDFDVAVTEDTDGSLKFTVTAHS